MPILKVYLFISIYDRHVNENYIAHRLVQLKSIIKIIIYYTYLTKMFDVYFDDYYLE